MTVTSNVKNSKKSYTYTQEKFIFSENCFQFISIDFFILINGFIFFQMFFNSTLKGPHIFLRYPTTELFQ